MKSNNKKTYERNVLVVAFSYSVLFEKLMLFNCGRKKDEKKYVVSSVF